MAKSELLLDLEENLTCPVCLDIYKDPKRLECEHSLCKLCVDHLLTNNAITCPVCRTKTTKANLKINLSLSSFVDMYRNRQNPQQPIPSTSSGEVNPRKRNAEGSLKKGPTDTSDGSLEKCELCELCEFQKSDHFCQNCKKLMCKCCVRAHAKLSGCSENDAGSLQGAVTRQIKLLEQEASVLAEKTGELKHRFNTAKNIYAEKKDQGMFTLGKAREELFAVVNEQISRQEKKLEEGAQEFDSQAEQIYCKAIQKVKKWQNAFSDLKSSKACEIAKKSENIKAELKNCIDTLQSAKFGEMELNIRNVDRSSLELHSNVAVQLLINSPSAPGEDNRLKNLLNKRVCFKKQMAFQSCCDKLLLIGNELWCFCSHFIRVHCARTLAHIKTWSYDIGTADNVVSIKKGQDMLVVARGGCFKVLWTDNQSNHVQLKQVQFGGGILLSICAYNEQYLALTEKNCKVFLERFVEWNGKFIQIKSVQTDLREFPKFSCPTMAVVNDKIFVTNYMGDKVYQLDQEGHTINSWDEINSATPRRLLCPVLCDSDSSCLLVADSGNHRLLVLQPDNKKQPWTVVYRGGENCCLSSAIVTPEGKLYYAKADSVVCLS